MDGWMDGWMDGCVGGWNGLRQKDWFQTAVLCFVNYNFGDYWGPWKTLQETLEIGYVIRNFYINFFPT